MAGESIREAISGEGRMYTGGGAAAMLCAWELAKQ